MTLLDEARATFRATLWCTRYRGTFMGVIPLYWLRFECIKEDGTPYNTTNRLILTAYCLWVAYGCYAVFFGPPAISLTTAAVMGFTFGMMYRWLKD